MKILWFTWKDMTHPQAGGAEVVNEELAKRMAASGDQVTFIVGGYRGAKERETRAGFEIIRLGNKWTIYLLAPLYYWVKMRGWPDLIIEEINTVPFFTKYFVFGCRRILFVHQLCREIWFHQIFFPLNLIGYLIEPIYLWLLSDQPTVTVSESSRQDLIRFGFKPDRINIISEGIRISSVDDLQGIDKFIQPTMLALGSIRSMKRTGDIILAFELAKQKLPELRLVVAGGIMDAYGRRVRTMIERSHYRDAIEYRGAVTEAEKVELLRLSHILCVTSVKEGWGLVVTEANSQGTPAVVYNVDGLRDSVRNNETGMIVSVNTPTEIAEVVVELLSDPSLYRRLQKAGWEWSKSVNFDQSFIDLKRNLTSDVKLSEGE